MSYSMMGAVDANCQPRGASNAFKLINGIAKPANCDALDAFQAFQAQLNRFGKGAVTVDGDIGPATAKIYNAIMKTSLSPSQIATGAPTITPVLKGLATAASLPAAKPIPAPRAQQKPNGTVAATDLPPPPEGSTFSKVYDFVLSPMGLVAGAGIVGLLFLSKRKRASTPVAPAAITVPKVA